MSNSAVAITACKVAPVLFPLPAMNAIVVPQLAKPGHSAHRELRRSIRGSIPMMGVPPDFLDVEGDAAAEVDGAVLFSHAEAVVVLKGLKRRAVVADVFEAPLDDDQVLVDLRRGAPIPVVLVARVGSRESVLRAEQVDG